MLYTNYQYQIMYASKKDKFAKLPEMGVCSNRSHQTPPHVSCQDQLQITDNLIICFHVILSVNLMTSFLEVNDQYVTLLTWNLEFSYDGRELLRLSGIVRGKK